MFNSRPNRSHPIRRHRVLLVRSADWSAVPHRELNYQIVEFLKDKGIRPTSSLVEEIRTKIIDHGVENHIKQREVYARQIEDQIRRMDLRLPNPTTGSDYCERVTIPFVELGLNRFRAEAPEGSGLTAEADASGVTVEGKALIPGDCPIKIFGYLDETYPIPEVEVEIPLFVNADPSKMWNDLPVPSDLPFQKADLDSESLLIPESGKRLSGASRRGRSHAHEALARDDDFRVWANPETGWYAVAVADGAGSAKYSRRGSEIACNTILDVIEGYLKEHHKELEEAIGLYAESKTNEDAKKVLHCLHDSMTKGAFEANRELNKEADKCADATVRDFHTTLLAAIAWKSPAGWFIGTYWVGDGAIALLTEEGMKLMGDPDGGQFAGETRFLTMNSIFSDRLRTRFTLTPDFRALLLMTDGVSDPRFDSDADLKDPACWEKLWEEIKSHVDLKSPEAGAQLLEWLNFYTKGHHDDRTIAILS